MAHTGPAAQKLVEAVQEDISEVVDLLERALRKIREVEDEGRGVNGLATTMKGQGNAIQEAMRVIIAEAESVAKKMLRPAPPDPIVQTIDETKLADVRKARAS